MTSLGARIAEGRTAEVYAWDEGTVVKLYRDWTPRRWIDEELQIARVVHAAGVAAPAPGEIVEINGRAGLVYERLDGPSMLEHMQKRWFLTVHQFAKQMAGLHVAMHRCQAPDLPRFRDRLAHNIGHAPDLPDALRAAVLRQLESLPDGDSLCHGDFHPGNILMTG
jgi:Ser/Thr protein kinase RdoA (MazF antagonist)